MRSLIRLLVISLLLLVRTVFAATLQVAPGAVSGSANGCSLIDAINAANTDTAVGPVRRARVVATPFSYRPALMC